MTDLLELYAPNVQKNLVYKAAILTFLQDYKKFNTIFNLGIQNYMVARSIIEFIILKMPIVETFKIFLSFLVEKK